MAQKILLDTNVFISNPSVLDTFTENEKICLHIKVLEELDNKKNIRGVVGRNSRKALSNIKKFLDSSEERVKLIEKCSLIKTLEKNNDNIIVSSAKKNNCIILTNDINVFLKSKTLGVECKYYERDKQEDGERTLYGGVEEIEISTDEMDSLHDGVVSVSDLLDSDSDQFLNNSFIIFKDDRNSFPVRKLSGGFFKNLLKQQYNLWNISPKNLEQIMAVDLLLDPKIKVVTLIGLAGSGKTLLSVAAGLQQIFNRNNAKLYDQMIVTRPIQTVGKDIGFLPGTMEEKMRPWIGPIEDSLEFLENKKRDKIQRWFDKGSIVVEAMSYIRGRSIADSYLLLDEAQNITSHEMKTIMTRVGGNTKIVITGDIEQIDNPKLSELSNGLSYLVDKFKGQDLFGHITLKKSERSEVAELAAKLL